MHPLSPTERHILKSLYEEDRLTDDDPHHQPVLDYWKAEPDWKAAEGIVRRGYARDESASVGHMVLRITWEGRAAFEKTRTQPGNPRAARPTVGSSARALRAAVRRDK